MLPMQLEWLGCAVGGGSVRARRGTATMTGRERVLAAMAGQGTDHLGLMPITMMLAADTLGVPYERYAREGRVMAAAQVKTAERYGFDHVSAIGPPGPESADLGAAVRWYADQPPAMAEAEALLAEKNNLDALLRRGAIAGERVENRVKGLARMRELVGGELAVEGWLSGPCAAAAELRGLNRLMVDFHDDPEFVCGLLDFVLEVGIWFAGIQVDAGADLIGIGDAAASLVGPRIYRECVWPREKKLVEAIHACGAKARLHICGNTRRILSEMSALGCDMVDIDFPVPMEEARAKMGPDVTLSGNLDPVREVRDGSPERLRGTLDELGKKAGPRWVVAAGCEIARGTPEENLRVLAKFARSH